MFIFKLEYKNKINTLFFSIINPFINISSNVIWNAIVQGPPRYYVFHFILKIYFLINTSQNIITKCLLDIWIK
jgi:hypothetical protein